MRLKSGFVLGALVPVLAISGAASSQTKASSPVFEVRLDAPVEGPVKGRLIILVKPATAEVLRLLAAPVPDAAEIAQEGANRVQVDPSPASGSAATARADVVLAHGQSVTVDSGLVAFPRFSTLKPGSYLVQAVLDTHGGFAYNQRPQPGDVTSAVTVLKLPAARPRLVLDKVQLQPASAWEKADPATLPPVPGQDAATRKAAEERYQETRTVIAHTERVHFPSKALSAFSHGRQTLDAYVLTPPGYDADKTSRYPVVFETEGFGATFEGNFGKVQHFYADMAEGKTPPMIWVFLDHSGPTGTHEFADSASNGPWGKILTTEFIPWLDGRYRTDGVAKTRFTTGHSSGGWASLWLQVAYPKTFGGAWPTSPDPVDFHDFTNINLYLAHPNAYRRPDGSPTPLVRSTRNPATFEQYAKSERVLGPVGGQISSFDWVFSPALPNGAPAPLFNPATGVVDPKVAAYWNAHYDITAKIKREWPQVKGDLDGKIHLWVGTLDTFYLDGPARRLKAALDKLGARSEFHFIDGASHSSVMTEHGDPYGVERTIAWQMYAVARPGTKRPPELP